MKTNPLKDGVLIGNSTGVGTVTKRMVLGRAEELAIINGRWLHQVSASDIDQARRELTGEPGVDPREALLEATPESERWNPVPGSAGQKTPTTGSEDEDEDGRSDAERLVDDGLAEAERAHMIQAVRTHSNED